MVSFQNKLATVLQLSHKKQRTEGRLRRLKKQVGHTYLAYMVVTPLIMGEKGAVMGEKGAVSEEKGGDTDQESTVSGQRGVFMGRKGAISGTMGADTSRKIVFFW